jgi:Amt family ammonium transporter
VLWHLIGYTLVFGRTLGGFIGNFDNVLMLGISYTDCSRHAPNIPAALFGFFQMMFAAISPLLITGAFAERLRYKSFVIFIIGWEIFIYYPVAHWIWGDGWLNKYFQVQVIKFFII